MHNAVLATTSTEGLQPLGAPAQRSFELISGTLNQRLGQKYAALFAEPVTNEAGDRIDWHAPVSGVAMPLGDLAPDEQAALRARLGAMIGDIRAEADALAQGTSPEDHRLSEALNNAIEVPDETMIYAIKAADGEIHPVLVHWGWVRNEQAAVRGVLTGMVPRAVPLSAVAALEKRGPSPLWWWLILLGWLLLAAILGAILYVLVTPCGVNRFGLLFCPREQIIPRDVAEERRIIADEIARLQRELTQADLVCQPVIPILPATPDPVKPAFPAPIIPDGQPDETKTESDRDEARARIAERGAELGALNFVLQWASLDDIDLYVTCPEGETISYSNRAGCGGRYDLDANVEKSTAISDPAENIVFENAVPGLYKVRAQLRSNRTSGPKTVTLHVLRKDGQSQSFSGVVTPEARDWTVNISISR